LPSVGAISNNPGVSADPVAKPAAHIRAESRILDLGKPLRERDRLSAGGNRIRTLGPPVTEGASYLVDDGKQSMNALGVYAVDGV
jgi:hypothetical protein